jgi:hypothetical protein
VAPLLRLRGPLTAHRLQTDTESVFPPHNHLSRGPDEQTWGTLARGEAPILPLIRRHNDEGVR